MAISVGCQKCGREYRVKEDAAGKKMTCKECGARIPIPAASEVEDYFDASATEDEGDESLEHPPLQPRARSTKKSAGELKSSAAGGHRVLPILGGVLGGLVLLGMVISVVSRLGGTGSTWIDYDAPDGSFRIKLPKSPKVNTQTNQSLATTVYRSEGASFVVEVSASKVGPNLALPGVAEVLLKSLAEEIRTKKPGSKIIREQPLAFREFAGREIEAEIKTERHLVRFYVCAETLFSVEFITPTGRSVPADEQRVFDSFDPAAGRRAGSVPAGSAAPGSPGSGPMAANPATGTYLQRRSAFQTKLTKQGPAPQEWEAQQPPADVQEVTYQSGSLSLKAWVGRPAGASSGKRPALVCFHGGFAFGADDFAVCEPFRQAGFIVMTPTLRGENGNPGHFELYFGEADDGRAAIKWLAQQPDVDANRIYAFGHSAGGGITALLSLFDDVPLRHCGSAGGLYPELTFATYWSDIVPFDISNSEERKLRILLGNLKDMQRPHYAYLGTQDVITELAQTAARAEAAVNKQLKIELLPGDHFSSFEPALRRYLRVCQADVAGGGAGTVPASSPPGPSITGQPTTPTAPQSANDRLKQLEEQRAAALKRLEDQRAAAKQADRERWTREAEQDELKAPQKSREAAWYYKEAALKWSKAGNKDRALANAKQAEDLGPEKRNEQLAHYWHRGMGETYSNLEDFKSAIPHLEKAIEKTDIDGYKESCQKLLDQAKAKLAE